jgi:hypothetical protein
LPRLALTGLLLTLLSLTSACVVSTRDRGYNEGYREGYYDREHHRYWHDRAWRDCIEHDEHCRD